MTDPGLTDLIAADLAKHRFIPDEGDDEFGSCSCLTWRGPNHDRHVALVVEQHTNGQHIWPKTTPTGFTYERPTTYADLEHMIGHMVQSEIECWDEPERPPEPVWEMIGIAQQEVLRLRAYIDTIVRSNARADLEGE